MFSIHEKIRQRLYQQAGLIEKPKPRFTLEQLAAIQWSDLFEKYMRNRLMMGGLRYGVFGQKGKPKYNSIESIRNRLEKYEETGNTECLVDIANLCMVEFIEGIHPKKHFRAEDDTNEKVKKL